MLNKIVQLLILSSCFVIFTIPYALAEEFSMNQSVQTALEYSSHLRALSHNRDAAQADVKHSKKRYFPSVDLMLGYGLEQYSDKVTRQAGADPDNTDWDPTSDASLKLTQKIYDGGEIRQNVSIRKALLETSSHRIQEARQAIALDAVIAHLEVYRQRQLLELAEANFTFHQDISKSLSEMEQAGAGNIADVTQTQARQARSQSNLFIIKAGLSRAVANYTRITGIIPGELAFAEVPLAMPETLEEAQSRMEQKNPELLIYNALFMEADARLGLAYAIGKPKLNLELSSRYTDQAEGDSSWQNTNDAMLVLRWNLFNGGQNKEMKNAALSKKKERQADQNDKFLELKEMLATTWTYYRSLQHQKKAFIQAKIFSDKTFDLYQKQFGVSRRDLLDVLSAKNEYFQSARQLITVNVNVIISAHRILMLTGEVPGTE
ncbi:MAG: TolC family protein [Desulfobacteraceae bacterium]|nr:TolC family protein [Desulfobacteraceae bacterium]